MTEFYSRSAPLRQYQASHNRDQEYDQDQADNVEDRARADHLGYRDHARTIDDSVLRGADRHHETEGGPEDRGEGWYQGVQTGGRGYRLCCSPESLRGPYRRVVCRALCRTRRGLSFPSLSSRRHSSSW